MLYRDENNIRVCITSIVIFPILSKLPCLTTQQWMSLSLCQQHRLGSRQWNISIIEMSVTLHVSISLIETSITPSLDVSSTPKLPHPLLPLPPLNPPPLKPQRRRGDASLRSPLGMCDFVWCWSLISVKVNHSDRRGVEEGVGIVKRMKMGETGSQNKLHSHGCLWIVRTTDRSTLTLCLQSWEV